MLRSQAGTRTLPAGEFQTGMLSTACRADEMVAAVRFPAAEPGAGYAFTEFARRHGDFAMVAIAALARANGVRIGVGGAAEQPVVREWPLLSDDALDDALNELAWSLDAVDDIHASARHRRELVRRPRQADGDGGAGGTAMKRLNADGRHRVGLTLNGREARGWAEPRLLLSDFLRHALGATGTHVGCEHGVCGACTVRLDGAPVRACLTLAVQAAGRRVDTVEGLAPDGELNDLQKAFRRHHALQCGFCTPRHPDVARCLARSEAGAGRSRAARTPQRPPLPLHRLCRHRRGRAGGRAGQVGRRWRRQ